MGCKHACPRSGGTGGMCGVARRCHCFSACLLRLDEIENSKVTPIVHIPTVAVDSHARRDSDEHYAAMNRTCSKTQSWHADTLGLSRPKHSHVLDERCQHKGCRDATDHVSLLSSSGFCFQRLQRRCCRSKRHALYSLGYISLKQRPEEPNAHPWQNICNVVRNPHC